MTKQLVPQKVQQPAPSPSPIPTIVITDAKPNTPPLPVPTHATNASKMKEVSTVIGPFLSQLL